MLLEEELLFMQLLAFPRRSVGSTACKIYHMSGFNLNGLHLGLPEVVLWEGRGLMVTV